MSAKMGWMALLGSALLAVLVANALLLMALDHNAQGELCGCEGVDLPYVIRLWSIWFALAFGLAGLSSMLIGRLARAVLGRR